LGYLNFLPTSVVGPPIEYQDYKRFMEDDPVYTKIPVWGLNKRLLITVGEFIFFTASFVFAEIYFPIANMRND
jgi:hypothetical protein